MSETVLLIRPAEQNIDGSRPVFTPPLGLWSMRTNNFGKRVEVIDRSVSTHPVSLVAEWVGYSILFPAHLRNLNVLRKFARAEREFIGGPTGGRDGWEEIERIEGAGESWLAGRDVPFGELEPPRFEQWEMAPYWVEDRPFGLPSKRKWMVIETSRGCPHSCNYCSIPENWGHWQTRPLDILDEYLGYLKAKGIEEIIVIDDNVALVVPRFLEIVELFEKHDLYWSCSNGIYNRVLLESSVMRALKGSKCVYLSLPFEAGNPQSASLMNLGKKYVNFAEALEITRNLQGLAIHTAGQFIIGYPGETEANVLDTLAYANALPLDERHIHIATPLKGTKMYDECIEKGYLIEDAISRATYKTPVISTPMLSASALYSIWKADRDAARRRTNE